MVKLTDKILEMWNEETYRIYQREPMLSWEACEMIAWNHINLKLDGDNNESVD